MESQNYLRGIQLFELNRYQDAIGYFKEALQEMPEDFDTIYYISYSYLQLDQIDKAEEIANSLLKIDADNENTYFLLAQISYYLKDLKKAMHHINKAISIYPYEADFFGQKSYIELYTKNYEASLKTANEGLSLDPNNKLCLNARVQALTKLNKKDEAFNSIENLLEKDPENVYSHANVGWSKLENGKTKEALTHFKEALSLDPNYEYAREGMSTALKANNFIYSVYLKYAFWIAKKSSKQQWIFFIGLYFTYKIIV